MKKLFIIFFLLFSYSVFSDETTIKCVYEEFDFKKKFKNKFKDKEKLFSDFFLPTTLKVELIHKSKYDWIIAKKEASTIEKFGKDIIKLTLKDPDKYSKKDMKIIKFNSDLLGQKVSSIVEEYKIFFQTSSKEELEEISIMVSERFNEIKKNQLYGIIGNTPDWVVPKKEIDEDPNKIPIDNLTGKELGKHVILSWITDAGVEIRIKLQYPDIIEKNKTDAFIKFINAEGDITLDIKGNCYNENSRKANNTINKDNDDDTINKLKKLKLMFEEELITQDEYDAKRKEILDAM